jgi:hypothetical protein
MILPVESFSLSGSSRLAVLVDLAFEKLNDLPDRSAKPFRECPYRHQLLHRGGAPLAFWKPDDRRVLKTCQRPPKRPTRAVTVRWEILMTLGHQALMATPPQALTAP